MLWACVSVHCVAGIVAAGILSVVAMHWALGVVNNFVLACVCVCVRDREWWVVTELVCVVARAVAAQVPEYVLQWVVRMVIHFDGYFTDGE